MKSAQPTQWPPKVKMFLTEVKGIHYKFKTAITFISAILKVGERIYLSSDSAIQIFCKTDCIYFPSHKLAGVVDFLF